MTSRAMPAPGMTQVWRSVRTRPCIASCRGGRWLRGLLSPVDVRRRAPRALESVEASSSCRSCSVLGAGTAAPQRCGAVRVDSSRTRAGRRLPTWHHDEPVVFFVGLSAQLTPNGAGCARVRRACEAGRRGPTLRRGQPCSSTGCPSTGHIPAGARLRRRRWPEHPRAVGATGARTPRPRSGGCGSRVGCATHRARRRRALESATIVAEVPWARPRPRAPRASRLDPGGGRAGEVVGTGDVHLFLSASGFPAREQRTHLPQDFGLESAGLRPVGGQRGRAVCSRGDG